MHSLLSPYLTEGRKVVGNGAIWANAQVYPLAVSAILLSSSVVYIWGSRTDTRGIFRLSFANGAATHTANAISIAL